MVVGVAVVLVGVGGVVGWSTLDGARWGTRASSAPDGEGEGIKCFTGAAGQYLVFTDAQGSTNIVESPSEVPPQHRSSVRCVSLKR